MIANETTKKNIIEDITKETKSADETNATKLTDNIEMVLKTEIQKNKESHSDFKIGDINLVFFRYTANGTRNWLIKVKFNKETIDKIDLDTFDITKFKDTADEYNIKPNYEKQFDKYYK